MKFNYKSSHRVWVGPHYHTENSSYTLHFNDVVHSLNRLLKVSLRTGRNVYKKSMCCIVFVVETSIVVVTTGISVVAVVTLVVVEVVVVVVVLVLVVVA